MKKFFTKITFTFFLAIALLCLSNVEAAAQDKWTYSMALSGATYKIHFQQERGTLTIQLYSSKVKKWNFATILASNPDEGYYKIQDSTNNVYELWTADDGTLTCAKGNDHWTYYLEQ